MAFDGAQPTSQLSQGDWTMGAGRKSRQLDTENDQYLEQAREQRESVEKEKAEQEKQIAQQQAKSIQAQAQGAAG